MPELKLTKTASITFAKLRFPFKDELEKIDATYKIWT